MRQKMSSVAPNSRPLAAIDLFLFLASQKAIMVYIHAFYIHTSHITHTVCMPMRTYKFARDSAHT